MNEFKVSSTSRRDDTFLLSSSLPTPTPYLYSHALLAGTRIYMIMHGTLDSMGMSAASMEDEKDQVGMQAAFLFILSLLMYHLNAIAVDCMHAQETCQSSSNRRDRLSTWSNFVLRSSSVEQEKMRKNQGQTRACCRICAPFTYRGDLSTSNLLLTSLP
jgi:hypothetical protein